MAEVAGAVTFLASRDAAFVNATDLKVLVLNTVEILRRRPCCYEVIDRTLE